MSIAPHQPKDQARPGGLRLLGASVAIVLFIAWWLAPYLSDKGIIPAPLVTYIILIPALLLLGLSAIEAYAKVQTWTNSPELRTELEPIRRERAELREKISKEPQATILDTIQLSLNQLTEYYVISKSQARSSFLVSVSAAVLGLLTLIGGIWIFYAFNQSGSSAVTISAVSAIGGIMGNFIAAAYFYLYNKTISQMNYYYDRLIKLQDTMLSIKLCEDIKDEEHKASLREKMVVALMSGDLAQLHRSAPKQAKATRATKQPPAAKSPDGQSGSAKVDVPAQNAST
jgi:hypothetical protein